MNNHPKKGQSLIPVFASLAVALILAVLFACDQDSQSADSSQTAISFNLAATSAASEIDPTPTLDANCMMYVQDPPDGNYALGDAEIKRHLDCLATKVALTHAPTWTPGAPPTDIPQSSPTLQMDSLMPCDHVGGYSYVLYTCWRATVGGQAVSIASGVESDGDPNQGVILIYHAPNFMFSKTDPDVYLTPIKVGAVEITSVTGTQFMLAQADPNQFGPLLSGGATFVFNLATRQWMSWDCGISCTPVPTTTPFSGRFRSSFDATKAAEEPFSPADDTRVAAAIATRKIELALTPSMPPAPTSTAGPPTPTYAEDLGVVKCPLQPNSHTYQPINCWRGLVNGNLVTVAVTVEGFGGAINSADRSYSAILVFNGSYTPYPSTAEDATQDGIGFVKTPPNSGIMQIISAQGMFLTLVPLDPHARSDTLYFDAATRQFVPPSCGQDGTCTPSEVATPPVMQTTTGIVNGGGAIPGPYAILNYWLGKVDGQVGAVASGAWRYGWQRNPDQNEGLIFVYKGRFLLAPTSAEVYRVPIEVGAMLITSVSGTQVTLSESVYDAASNSLIPLRGGATVVFDIATRQFLSAQCGQDSSSCTPVPVGTTTPAR